MSNHIPAGVAAKRDKLTEHLWRRGASEKPEAVEAAANKAKRSIIAFNKGPYVYATDADLTPGRIDKTGKI